MCDSDTIQFVMFTVWMFTFVAASCGSLYDSIAFVFYLLTKRQASVICIFVSYAIYILYVALEPNRHARFQLSFCRFLDWWIAILFCVYQCICKRSRGRKFTGDSGQARVGVFNGDLCLQKLVNCKIYNTDVLWKKSKTKFGRLSIIDGGFIQWWKKWGGLSESEPNELCFKVSRFIHTECGALLCGAVRHHTHRTSTHCFAAVHCGAAASGLCGAARHVRVASQRATPQRIWCEWSLRRRVVREQHKGPFILPWQKETRQSRGELTTNL